MKPPPILLHKTDTQPCFYRFGTVIRQCNAVLCFVFVIWSDCIDIGNVKETHKDPGVLYPACPSCITNFITCTHQNTAGEIAQLVKCLLYQHEDPGSSPRTLLKMPGVGLERSWVQVPTAKWWFTTTCNGIWCPLLVCLKTATVNSYTLTEQIDLKKKKERNLTLKSWQKVLIYKLKIIILCNSVIEVYPWPWSHHIFKISVHVFAQWHMFQTWLHKVGCKLYSLKM